jgi:HSP20 family protein
VALSLSPRRSSPPQSAQLDPVGELSQMQSRLGRLIDVWPWSAVFEDGAGLADIEETDDAYIVDIDLPGVKKSDINIEVVGDRLVIRGERKERERKGVLRRRVRTVGEFRYEIELPGEIDPEQVSASLSDGTLSLVLPKASSERAKRIQVQ